MHIIHLARRYAPLRGGVETHVAEISRHHLADGHRVTVITIQEEVGLKLESIEEGVEVLRIPHVPRLAKRERTWEFKQHVWSWFGAHSTLLEQADVIHVHDVFWWLWPHYPRFSAKIFTTFHGWEGQYPVRWQAKLQRWITNQLSQGVIHVGDWIQEFYGDHPDYVVYGGSDPQLSSTVESEPAETESPANGLRLVFVGRLEAVNEIGLYIELLQLLKKKNIEFAMTWVGDGSYRDRCAELGTVTGMIAETHRYLQTADLVFANSYLTLLESQVTAAVVVAAYSNPLKKRYLETYPIPTGLIIGDSAEMLAAQLETLGHNPSRWEKATAQAAAEAREYTWEKVAQLYSKLWRKKFKI